MKAFVTVIGHDNVGVIARVSGLCAELHINVEDVTQSILQGMFAMIMLVEFGAGADFGAFVDAMRILGEQNGLIIQAMHEDIFNSMHRI